VKALRFPPKHFQEIKETQTKTRNKTPQTGVAVLDKDKGMSVQRLEAKCVELVARRYDRYASALERAGVAPPVWDALWECMVRRNLLAVGSAERWDFGPLLRHHLRPVVGQEGGEAMALDVSGDASGARAAPLTLFAWLAEQIVRACPSLNRLVRPPV
jgi:hypothetical protein